MSRFAKLPPTGAVLVAALLTACSVERPVGPEPEEPAQPGPETEVPEAPDPQVVPDEYIVIYKPGLADPEGMSIRIASDHGLTMKHEYRHVLRGFAARIPADALGNLRNDPRIERIEPNYSYKLQVPKLTASAVAVPQNGLRVRLVADDLGPGDVAAWPNRGSDGEATQTNASRRPQFRVPSADFGGHASVGFNEGGDNDEVLEITGVAAHTSATIIAVFRQEDANQHNYGLATLYGGKNSRASAVSRYKSSGMLVYWDSHSGWSNGTAGIDAGRTYVAAWRVDAAGSVDLQVDGAEAGTSALNGPIPSFDSYLFGMTEPSTSSRFDGWLAEIIVYDRPLADCERDEIVAALGIWYAVALAPGFGPCGGTPPAAPANLQATADGESRVLLSWDDQSSDEIGFELERDTGPDSGWQLVATLPAEATVFEDIDLTPSTTYCYRVRAINGSGSSPFSLESCATTETPPPPPPPIGVSTVGLRVRLVANDLAAGDVASWPNRGSEADAAQASTSRRPVYVAPSALFGGNAAVGFNEGSDNDEALEITGVSSHGSGTLIAVFSQEGTSSHNYGIFGAWGSSGSRAGMVTRANSTGGGFDYWDSTNGWVDGPEILAAGTAYVGSWRVSAAEAVDLRVNGSPAGSKNITTGLPGFNRYVVGMTEPSTSTRFDGQMAELLFYDRVLVDCELDQITADLADRYGIAVAVNGGTCSPPADPTGLSATAVGYDAIDLAWTDNSSNEDGFRVERRLGQAGAWELIATTGPNVTTYESLGLIQQTEYCYRVSAFNGDGSSGLTNVGCATTESAPPGACVDSGNHDDLSLLYGIQAIGAPSNQTWASTQVPGCEITPWYFGLDSGVDSDHPDLNVQEAANFVSAEAGHDGEDGNGHGTHTAGTAAARDGNGGVVGVAPGAPIFSFRVCEDGGSCQTADMVAAMDEVVARKLANPEQPMVANMSIGGPIDEVIDQAIRSSINEGIVYAVAAGNGVLGACIFPANATNVSPARTGDDEINAGGGSVGDDGLINGVLTTTSHNSSFTDVNCNYGAPVSIAAPGYQIRSTWLNGGYNTISGTSMATPHAAGAALLYLQTNPDATPAEVEAAIVSRLLSWTTNESPNASGRLNVNGLVGQVVAGSAGVRESGAVSSRPDTTSPRAESRRRAIGE